MTSRLLENSPGRKELRRRREIRKYVEQKKTDYKRWKKDVWDSVTLFEQKFDAHKRLLELHLRKQDRKATEKEQWLTTRQQRLEAKVAAKERVAAYVGKGYDVKRGST
ncbi:hypothetical protein QAD02_011002 [Eretmocerus hayati]|uniref:Uncharacterized protein n=1 Tax=Eretmocerus hayati TaxID=131215 RepID=A0ACC2NVN9_9HYME|nr:hypothetical protein QAD02_011002 [Eretmocerus hayati]